MSDCDDDGDEDADGDGGEELDDEPNPSFYFLRQCFHVSIYSISKFEPNTVYVNFLWRQTILIILMSSSITELPSKPRLVFIVQV